MMTFTLEEIPFIGFIIKFIREKINKCIEGIKQPFYEKSHDIYAKKHYGLKWEKLYDDIEYSLYLENVYSNDTNPSSKVYIKSKNNYESVELLVEARIYGYRYQDYVIFKNINEESFIQHTLSSIPLQSYDWNSGTRPYKDVVITVVKIQKENELIDINEKIEFNNLFFQDVLPDRGDIPRWDKKWNKIYNIQALNWAKQKLKENYTSVLGKGLLSYWKYLESSNNKINIMPFNFFMIKLKTETILFEILFWWKLYKKKIKLS